MLTLLKQLSRDDHGVILTTELVIVGTVLTIGLVTGMNCLRQSIETELSNVGNAIGSLDQSYSFSAHHKSGRGGQGCAFTAGSSFVDCEEVEVVSPIVPQIPSNCCDSVPCLGAACGRMPCEHSTGCGGCGVMDPSIGHLVPRFRVTETLLTPCVPAGPMSGPILRPIPENYAFGHVEEAEDLRAGDLIIPDFVW